MERGRRLRAGFVGPHPGGCGSPSGPHYEGSAPSRAGRGQGKGRKAPPPHVPGSTVPQTEKPQWSAGRRASGLIGRAALRQRGSSRAPSGAPLPSVRPGAVPASLGARANARENAGGCRVFIPRCAGGGTIQSPAEWFLCARPRVRQRGPRSDRAKWRWIPAGMSGERINHTGYESGRSDLPPEHFIRALRSRPRWRRCGVPCRRAAARPCVHRSARRPSRHSPAY
jgi:hypothetical protein